MFKIITNICIILCRVVIQYNTKHIRAELLYLLNLLSFAHKKTHLFTWSGLTKLYHITAETINQWKTSTFSTDVNSNVRNIYFKIYFRFYVFRFQTQIVIINPVYFIFIPPEHCFIVKLYIDDIIFLFL